MEGMATNAIELLTKHAEQFKKLSTFLNMADDEFLLGHWGEWEATPGCLKARDLVRQVVTRTPFVRALAFRAQPSLWQRTTGLGPRFPDWSRTPVVRNYANSLRNDQRSI